MNRFDVIILILLIILVIKYAFNNSDVVDSKFKLFALSYNILRIVSGTAGLAY